MAVKKQLTADMNKDTLRSQQHSIAAGEISTVDQAQLAQLIISSLSIKSPEDMQSWILHRLRLFFPHSLFIATIGEVQADTLKVEHVINVGFSTDYLNAISTGPDLLASPIIGRWYQDRKPQLFDSQEWMIPVSTDWLSLFHRHDLKNVASYGVVDLAGHKGSYFSFARIPSTLTRQHALLLELLVPFLHQALIRAVNTTNRNEESKQVRLAQQESKVLFWLAQGKTNVEIAELLERSEFTVRNHVRAIFAKLQVHNRTQAVSEAMKYGLIVPFYRGRLTTTDKECFSAAGSVPKIIDRAGVTEGKRGKWGV